MTWFKTKDLAGCWGALRIRAQLFCRAVREKPSIVVFPILLLAVLWAMGITLVLELGNNSADGNKTLIAHRIQDSLTAMSDELEATVLPIEVLAALAREKPQWGELQPLLGPLSTSLLGGEKFMAQELFKDVYVGPQGLVAAYFPQNSPQGIHWIGVDLFGMDYIRRAVMRTMAQPRVQMLAPTEYASPDGAKFYSITLLRPVWVPGSYPPGETFGTNHSVTNCPPEACYKPDTNETYWGHVATTIQLNPFLHGPDSRLSWLDEEGVDYELQYRLVSGQPSDAEQPLLHMSGTEGRLRNPVQTSDTTLGLIQWTLSAEPSGGSWRPSWQTPLLVVVILGSLLLSLLFMQALLSRHQHKALLESLLPKDVVSQLRQQGTAGAAEHNNVLTGTPAEALLRLLASLLRGVLPPLPEVMLLRTCLLHSLDIYRPLDLGRRVKGANLEDDVAQELMRQLGAGNSQGTGPRRSAAFGGGGAGGLGGGGGGGGGLGASAAGGCRDDGSAMAATLDSITTEEEQRAEMEKSFGATLQSGLHSLLLGHPLLQEGGPEEEKEDAVSEGRDSPVTPHHNHGGSIKALAALGDLRSAVAQTQGRTTSAQGGSGQVKSGPFSIMASLARAAAGVLHHSSHTPPESPSAGSAKVAAAASDHQVMVGSKGTQPPPHPGADSPIDLSFWPMPALRGRRSSSSVNMRRSQEVEHAAICVTPTRALSSNLPAEARAGAGGSGPGKMSVLALVEGRQSNQQQHPTSPGVSSAAGGSRHSMDLLSRFTRMRPGAGSAPSSPRRAPQDPDPQLQADEHSEHHGNRQQQQQQQKHSTQAQGAPITADGDGQVTPATANVNGTATANGSVTLVMQQQQQQLPLAQSRFRRQPSLPEKQQQQQQQGQGQGQLGGQQAAPQVSQPAPSPAITPAMLEESERLLARTSEWQFDMFALQHATGGHALSALGFYLMHQAGLTQTFGISPLKLARYLRHVESGYQASNPYHNATHAADVLRSLHVLVTRGGLLPGYVDPLTHLACYLVAIIHDYEHVGLTNDFLIASSHDLALRYNDKAPLENHHTAAAFAALKRPGLDFLSCLPSPQMTTLRKLAIDLVMATDMKQHFSIISHFSSIHCIAEASSAATASAWAADLTARPRPSNVDATAAVAMDDPRSSAGGASTLSGKALSAAEAAHLAVQVPVDEAERLVSLQMALKCADLGHLAADLPVHERWVQCLEEEFFRQGDRERAVGLPISPLFDRCKQGVSKSQVGFFNFVVIPLFHNFAKVFPRAQPLQAHVSANYRHWLHVEARATRSTGQS